ncbi:hypothetical protein ACHAW5_001834 [Stephanodiscus triporus]|uniref:SET domain-containing protein n=1 Tax=Stephanodiscus triporus TaxID=2934178 RepID=A0ABD3QNM8_9STRA
MSFQPQRYFSLSTSSNPSTKGQTVNGGNKNLDPSSLDLLLRAAIADKSAGNINNGVIGMSWQHNLGAAPDDNNGGDNSGAGAETSRTTFDRSNPNVNANNQNQSLHHAFLQSMAPQTGGGSSNSGSAMFGTSSQGGQSSSGGFNLANGGTSSGQAHQFGNLFGGMNQINSSAGGAMPQVSGFGGGGGGGFPQAQISSQGQWNDQGYGGGGSSSLAAQAANQGDMISQLVASLQAQQQAQQQAQVQAALARAFGPQGSSAGGGGTFDLAGTLGGNGGMTNFGDMNTNVNHVSAGMSAMSGQGPALSHQNTAARDLLSRMQHVQHQQSDAPMSSSTADDLIKLQLEQEHHNHMVQIAQADRQERAMQANQDALMKKARWDIKNSGGNNGIAPDGGNNIFNQAPQVGGGFPSNFNDSLLNGSGLNAAQQFANAKLSSIVGGMNHQGGMSHGGINAAALQSSLLSAGINRFVGLASAAGGMAGGIESSLPGTENQFLHQKLGSSRRAAIVPCRARGMPVDHNFKTAYFVIPDSIEHGDELMCSYPSCRQAGVKFRYCLQCKVPVAKRNFRNRHRHGVPGGEGEDCGSSDEDDESEEMTSEDAGHGPVGYGEEHGICRPVPSSAADADDEEEDYTGVQKEHILIIPGVDSAAAAYPSSSNTMEKKKRKNSSVRVPCRARGMPMAHNFKTAYFMIPPTIDHGDELLCSFPSCRGAGAKFRYCLHCKVPVAKRNFRNRHKHGNMGGLDKKKVGGDLKSPEGVNDGVNESSKRKSPEGLNDGCQERKDSKIEASESTFAAHVDGGENPPSVQPGGEVRPADAKEDNAAVVSNGESDVSSRVTITSSQGATKIQRWVELLESKPDPEDKQAMAVWMMNLMNSTEGAAAAVPTEADASSAIDVFAAATDRVEEEE